MRAFVVKEYAHPSKVPLSQDAPEPKPKDDEVVVEVFSAGLNYYDILQAQGKYQNQPPFPFTLGSEFAGRIAAASPIPKGCPFKPGDKVFGAHLLPLPATMTYDQGAGLVGRAELKPGEWVLVTAAAGGVGIAAVQLAKALGAKVIAAAGSQEKIDVAVRYGGADHGVNYGQPNWQKEVLKLTGGKGVNIVYDPVGMIRDSLKCIAWKGRAVVVGFAAGQIEKLPLNLVLLKNISIVGIHWGAYSIHEPQHIPEVHKAINDLLSSGRVKPVVYTEVFPLERLADGLHLLEQRKTWGKVVVRIRDEKSGERAKL
ncbi:uncharacterized protein B0H18DRAFT_1174277 [Fomitopsis serialis]|uniref:uncharacterized protein n=1 Tax=Fomitopsis serialis TaxID=139415 RepID=UPI0020085D34|nr:uncharacterized protein B0H18DRAFT_1174277 [Neoantrodia serialis]KAH9935553.1 hypothetical protein B0H18DRAFT_1174277 [Neoantrodia serialis]